MLEKSLLSMFENSNEDVKEEIWGEGILKSLIKKPVSPMREIKFDVSDTMKQGKTGYCWLSSVLFCVSQFLRQKRGINYNNFSKTYLIFFDKLEKANHFLELFIQYSNSKSETQNKVYLLNNCMTDQGQWNMAENLIIKYGVVPYDSMPDNTNGKSTVELNACLSYLLRYYALVIDKVICENKNSQCISDIKNSALCQVYKLLVRYFGKPPLKVKLPKEFGDADDSLSPLIFFKKYIKFPFGDYYSVCSVSRHYYIDYEIELDGNVIEGKRNTNLSLPDEIFNSLLFLQIEDEHYCWVSCDAGKFCIDNYSIYDDNLFDLKKIIGDRYEGMTRNQMFEYCVASPTHAVTLTDILINNGSNYYVSYDSSKERQYCYMEEGWLKKYIFQAIVNKKILNQVVGLYDFERRSLKPWEFFNMRY